MFSTKAKTIISFPFRLVVQIFLPYQSLYSPTHNMLNAAPKKKQDHMLQDWKERTLFELNFIGLVATLLGSIVAAALAWPVVIPWSVRALWLTALLFALIALSIAAQQSITLKRTVCAEYATEKLKYLLGEPILPTHQHSHLSQQDPQHSSRLAEPKPGDEELCIGSAAVKGHEDNVEWRPLKLQLYVWQIPSMLLGNAILLFVVGLAVWVFATARAAGWGDDAKIAVFFGAFMVFVAANYFLSWAGIEGRVRVGVEEIEKIRGK